MGIKGLHKGLSFCTKKWNITRYSRKRIAVDASAWLHRSVYSCSQAYVESMERGSFDAYCVRASAAYMSSRCRELLVSAELGEVILVMDGKRCPMKAAGATEERERRRLKNLQEARSLAANGLTGQAEDKYKACIKIRDNFAARVMDQVAREFSGDRRVRFVWSPYEADAQLAQLCVEGRADAVITEVRT